MTRPDSPISQQRWLPCINVGAETVPPFAPVRVVGFERSGHHLVYRVAKPDGGRDPFEQPSWVSQSGWFGGGGQPDDTKYNTQATAVGFSRNAPLAPGRPGVFTLELPTVCRFVDREFTLTPRIGGGFQVLGDSGDWTQETFAGSPIGLYSIELDPDEVSPELVMTHSTCLRHFTCPDDVTVEAVHVGWYGFGPGFHTESVLFTLNDFDLQSLQPPQEWFSGTGRRHLAYRATVDELGMPLTPADINSAGFGFKVKVRNTNAIRAKSFLWPSTVNGGGGGPRPVEPIELDLDVYFATDEFALKTTPFFPPFFLNTAGITPLVNRIPARDMPPGTDAFQLLQTLETNDDYSLGIFVKTGAVQ